MNQESILNGQCTIAGLNVDTAVRLESFILLNCTYFACDCIQLITVLHYQRKRRPNANYSLEGIFEDVRKRLADRCRIDVRIAPQLSSGILARLNIVRDVRKIRQENIHVTGDINFATLGCRRHSSILTILDCGFVHRNAGLRRWLLSKFWLEWPLAWSSVVTTISESAKADIVTLTGCNPDRIKVIPVAISEAFQPTSKAGLSTRPRILHVGTAPNKNLEKHILALQGVDCRLVILGEISDRIKGLLSQCKIDYELHVDVKNSEVVRLYTGCDMLLFASTFEGFGMPILEAQAVGRPVITSNISSMPEVAGEGALLVNPLDVNEIKAAVVRVISDDSLRADLVLKGFENVKRFDGQAIANQYLELYQKIWGK